MEYKEIIDFVNKFSNVLGISFLSIYLLIFKFVKSKGISTRNYRSNLYTLLCLLVYCYFLFTFLNKIDLDLNIWIMILFILYTNLEFVFKLKPSFTIVKFDNKPHLLLENKNDKLKVQSLKQFKQSNKNNEVNSGSKKNLDMVEYTVLYPGDKIDFYEFDMLETDYLRYIKSWSFWWLILSNLLLVILAICILIELPYIKIITTIFSFYILSFVFFFPILRNELFNYKHRLQEYQLKNFEN
ncbi:hypothetical protein [Staphylococcus equorum]|uniref:hypothetical protein n=1 Tax=Staphylococcus equorum TaxID=246432 RepID=UPI000D1C89F6|nr:hypothetical protein [Staphylococcus equorum]PTE43356.1 hypothetical protein BUY77_05515 [Staphylococcus equorum]RIL48103.1 hypothetical protein BUY82_06120 [Staphylococcus equorum]